MRATIICSRPFFQISSEQFLVLTASQSTVQIMTGICWTLLTSAFLQLMHLPAINHIDLSSIENFPLSSLALSVNLHRLDISDLRHSNPLDSSEIVVQSDMPKIREFHTSESSLLTSKLLHAELERQDGRPALDVMNLRRLSMFSRWSEDEQNIRYLLPNAELLKNSIY